MKSKYMEVSAVARRLSVSAETVYNLMRNKDLAWIRVGVKKGYRVVRKSVEAFERKRLQECADDNFDLGD